MYCDASARLLNSLNFSAPAPIGGICFAKQDRLPLRYGDAFWFCSKRDSRTNTRLHTAYYFSLPAALANVNYIWISLYFYIKWIFRMCIYTVKTDLTEKRPYYTVINGGTFLCPIPRDNHFTTNLIHSRAEPLPPLHPALPKARTGLIQSRNSEKKLFKWLYYL